MAKTPRFVYEQTCSRCGGSGDDPVIANCACDCCEGTGTEILELTEAEAINYPNATRVPAQGTPTDGKLT